MSEFMQKVPGCYFIIGAGDPILKEKVTHHDPKFDIDEIALPIATNIMIQSVLDYIDR